MSRTCRRRPRRQRAGTGIVPGNGELGGFDTDYSDVNSCVGQQVMVSADVNDVISPTTSNIAGTENTAADELLVLRNAQVIIVDSANSATATVTFAG